MSELMARRSKASSTSWVGMSIENIGAPVITWLSCRMRRSPSGVGSLSTIQRW